MWREKAKTLEFWRGRLPHWEVGGGVYFVTIHLAGALPQSAAKRIHAISQQLSRHQASGRCELQRRIFRELENWLDRSMSVRYLANSDVAELVMHAIEYRAVNHIWDVFEYVIIPSHIHLLIEILSGGLKKSLESFKERTGKLATEIVRQAGGRFWQKEWFDHWIRNSEEMARISAYIRQNPVKAGLVSHYEEWPYGSWRSSRAIPSHQ